MVSLISELKNKVIAQQMQSEKDKDRFSMLGPRKVNKKNILENDTRNGDNRDVRSISLFPSDRNTFNKHANFKRQRSRMN